MINTIKNGSVVVWRHINLQGEYDFYEDVLKNSIEFSLPEILELKVLENGKSNIGVKPWLD